MKYKALIFDFDGVLFDSEKIHLQACNKVLKKFGMIIEDKEYFQNYVGLSDTEMFEIITKEKNIHCTVDEIKILRRDKINSFKEIIGNSDSLSSVPNVKDFIEYCATKIDNFAICTGATQDEINFILNKLESGELKKYFKHIITIDNIILGKPSPEGYLLAAKKLNISPEYCLVIEDTPKGIAAAKNAGMYAIAITTSCDKSLLTEADFIANNYYDIDVVVKALL